MDMGGWYEYDEEGMPAVRVEVIKDGILKSFLMSRMPSRILTSRMATDAHRRA
jgi:TldD protein